MDTRDDAAPRARTVTLRAGVPRLWEGRREADAAWGFASTNSRQPLRSALLLGIGGGMAPRDFAGEPWIGAGPASNVLIVEPDAALRDVARALDPAVAADLTAGEESIPPGATFEVVLVDAQEDGAWYSNWISPAGAPRVRALVSQKGLLIVRRIARPSDARLASAMASLGAGLPFRRFLGTRLDDEEQDLLLVMSRRPIDGIRVFLDVPRVTLPLPSDDQPRTERDMTKVRVVADGTAETHIHIGYVVHEEGRQLIDTPCPRSGEVTVVLATNLPALEQTGEEYPRPAPAADPEASLQSLIGVGGDDDCISRCSGLVAAVEGTEPDDSGFEVSRVLMTLTAAQWIHLRESVIAPRTAVALGALHHGDLATAERALADALLDLEQKMGPVIRSTRAFDATLAMREILASHMTAKSGPRQCEAMLKEGNAYFDVPVDDRSVLDADGGPIDAVEIRNAFLRCAAP